MERAHSLYLSPAEGEIVVDRSTVVSPASCRSHLPVSTAKGRDHRLTCAPSVTHAVLLVE